jgi:hypothetical protein
MLVDRNAISSPKQTFEEAKKEASTHPKEFLLGNLKNYALKEA